MMYEYVLKRKSHNCCAFIAPMEHLEPSPSNSNNNNPPLESYRGHERIMRLKRGKLGFSMYERLLVSFMCTYCRGKVTTVVHSLLQ
jgi:hypothetical protein